jgi:hypothetical protein
MAIENLYTKWVNSKSQLKYRLPNENVNAKKTESFKDKTENAIKMLEIVSEYYEDFDEVIKELKSKKS